MLSIHSLLDFPRLFSRPSSQTRLPSPIGCYPSCRCGRIALVSCPWSAERHIFLFQVVVLFPHTLFFAASVYEVFSWSTSFQMPAVNLCLFSLASMSRMHSSTLLTHVFIMMSLVGLLFCYWYAYCSTLSWTQPSLQLLVRSSSWSLYCIHYPKSVSFLGTNSVTFAIRVFPINSSSSMASCPNTTVLVFGC